MEASASARGPPAALESARAAAPGDQDDRSEGGGGRAGEPRDTGLPAQGSALKPDWRGRGPGRGTSGDSPLSQRPPQQPPSEEGHPRGVRPFSGPHRGPQPSMADSRLRSLPLGIAAPPGSCSRGSSLWLGRQAMAPQAQAEEAVGDTRGGRGEGETYLKELPPAPQP